MKVTWTNTFEIDFDLDRAQYYYESKMEYNPNSDPDKLIYDAIEAVWNYGGGEYIDYSEAIEICAQALRKRIGGIQMRMELI